MIIVTGGAGFIGSNLVKGLNEQGHEDILVVDDLSNGAKFTNLVDCTIADYQDKSEFIDAICNDLSLRADITAIFHLGACSVTTEWDGHYMLENNYTYSKQLLHVCLENRIPFIYASSASVYGNGREFRELPECEQPINVYAYSKFLFDQYVNRQLKAAQSPIVGLRYFNVYGPREQHKDRMASVAYHFNNQIKESGTIRLFAGSDGYADGEQRRDFIYADDAVSVNLWFLEHGEISGIFNVGTGESRSFNDIAKAVVSWHGYGEIQYIPFPDELSGRYQSFTEADISALRKAGYDHNFCSIEEGIRSYMEWLNN